MMTIRVTKRRDEHSENQWWNYNFWRPDDQRGSVEPEETKSQTNGHCL